MAKSLTAIQSFPYQTVGVLDMRKFFQFLLVGTAIACCCHPLHGQDVKSNDVIYGALEQRVAEDPGDASAWRLLGRIHLERQQLEQAVNANTKAVELAPNSAGGHFDLARALLASDETEQAAYHFAEVVDLAAESDYGIEAASYLQTINDSNVVPPRADLEPNRFGGVTFQSAFAKSFGLKALVDVGSAYNSNVLLAPILRESVGQGPGSAQMFVSPQVEAILFSESAWESGISFNGYFTFNETHIQEFNVQDYQPGAFVERSLDVGQYDWTVRTQYEFSLNEFQGAFFGRRHAITSSIATERTSSTHLVYWSIDYSDFANDGTIPSQSSLDGWTNTLGTMRAIYDVLPALNVVRCGIDFQNANLRGDDFAYRGIFTYLETETQLPMDFWLELEMGGGYRDYPNFVGDPSRNEVLWRAGVELSRDWSRHCTITAFSTYDRFASRNELFDAERYYTGLMTTYRR